MRASPMNATRQATSYRGDFPLAHTGQPWRLPAVIFFTKRGAACGNRTRDLLITSETLYQLS